MSERKYSPTAEVRGGWEPDAVTPKRMRITTATHGAWVLTAHWNFVDGASLEPTYVKFRRSDGRAVKADAIRKLPMGEMLEESREELLEFAHRAKKKSQPEEYEPFAPVFEPLLTVSAKGSQRGRGLTDDELQEVVDVYRRAQLIGEPVTHAVQLHFVLSRDGAAKRIGRARAWLRERGEEL